MAKSRRPVPAEPAASRRRSPALPLCTAACQFHSFSRGFFCLHFSAKNILVFGRPSFSWLPSVKTLLPAVLPPCGPFPPSLLRSAPQIWAGLCSSAPHSASRILQSRIFKDNQGVFCDSPIISDFPGSAGDPPAAVGDPPTARCAADNLIRSAAFPACR